MWGVAALLMRSADREPEANGGASGFRSRTLSGIPVSREGDLLGSAVTMQRLIADPDRRQKYAPIDNSPEAFSKWLADTGVTIDCIDWFSELYIAQCELMGWSLPGEAPELEAEVEIEAGPDPVQAPIDPQALAKLEQAAAAEQFAEWLRLANKCGTYSTDELSELYAEHCKAEDLDPVSEMHMRAILETLPGIRKRLARGKQRNGKRHRPIRWTISPLKSQAEIPWVDLPERIAA